LVMGAFSGSRLRQFFIGSNTIMMLESCNIPIMVVK
jgi:nucleotide-binding universal stress UspA family protein